SLDWSSYVCSSDLIVEVAAAILAAVVHDLHAPAAAARAPIHAAYTGSAVLVGTSPVLVVLLARDGPQMLRVYTRTHVASVIKLHPGGDRAAVHLVYGAVREDMPPAPSDLAVAEPARSRCPQPAPVRLGRHLDLGESALFESGWIKMFRRYAVLLAANVSKSRPGSDGAAVPLIRCVVRKDRPSIPSDLAVAVPARTCRPQPAPIWVGGYLDLREQ